MNDEMCNVFTLAIFGCLLRGLEEDGGGQQATNKLNLFDRF